MTCSNIHRDHNIDVLCLIETWHDDGCVAFSRLRAGGYQVIDRPRLRRPTAGELSTNHGGFSNFAVLGVHLAPVAAFGDTPTTFEYVCARVTVGHCRGIR